MGSGVADFCLLFGQKCHKVVYSLYMDDQKQGGEELHKVEKETAPKGTFAVREEEVLAFWNEHKVFEQSLEKPAPRGEYTFYDGPPFATGLPHYGHLLQSALKDAIPRYRTMRGYHVPRRWGWDCHGLPLENQIEQELGFKTKRDIEHFGVGKFNAAAQGAVLRYADEWKRIIPRMGRWVDMEGDYKTMDATYTESVWWAFKNLYDRGLIYEGYKAMHYCPRCGTTLSNFEVAQAYQDIDDYAVTVRLPLHDEPDTSLLIWTTTPWTLPANTAAAVNAEATYVKVRHGKEFVIVAKELAHKVLGEDLEVVGEMLGAGLVGRSYEPPFSYFKDSVHKHKTHAWKVYAAPYVTLTDGTGIVHLAPAFGEEDLLLAQKEKIPVIHHLTDEGKFIATVTDFAHLPAKPKGRHMETDEKIVAYLEASGALFAQEKIQHSYPHCWRCDTPLLNWATNSWFVKVSALKSKLLAENRKVSWVPSHVGTGRFEKGLESAPDWAISRARYWGAPLPVWRHSKTKEIKVVGSVDELLTMVRRSGNRYFVMRHGEARSNVEGFVHNDDKSIENHLTHKGRAQAKTAAARLKAKANIDLIVVSPLARAHETAALVKETLGLSDAQVMTDERLRETGLGVFHGKSLAEWEAYFTTRQERFTKAPEGGETYAQIRARIGEVLFDIDRRYTGKNILLVTHGVPSWLLHAITNHISVRDLAVQEEKVGYLKNAEVAEFAFTPFPHNEQYELDLHRPFIDDLALGDTLSGEWERVPDVFDCWFESGSMPFASNHYPFKKDVINPKRLFGLLPKGYPADFIAESIDQTRGWFYSSIVLGTALFGRSSYKAVVTNGLILAQDGRKMSKKLKNYPDPMELVDTYGADALRYYLLSSPVIRGEDLRFTARGVEEVSKKLLMRLDNVRSFYELYVTTTTPVVSGYGDFPGEKSPEVLAPSRSKPPATSGSSSNILDRWIQSRLGELVRDTTAGFESYELDVATRPLALFIDDLSVWYVRRSRDRFKSAGADRDEAMATLSIVLYTMSHVMAPVLPFFAESLYQKFKAPSDPMSVHLSGWPEAHAIDAALLVDMEVVRALCSRGLELRERAGIKIRQPLARFTARAIPQDAGLRALIMDELNVKEVFEDAALVEDAVLDTHLTPELLEEGMVRDTVRAIQDFRKTQKLTLADRPTIRITTSIDGEKFLQKFTETLVQETGLSELHIATDSAATAIVHTLDLV